MRTTIAIALLLAGCMHASPAPVNYADHFVDAVFPNAPRGADIVFVVIDKQLAACVAEGKQTTCHAVASWAPQPPATTVPNRAPAPAVEQPPAPPQPAQAPVAAPVLPPAKPSTTPHPSAAGPK